MSSLAHSLTREVFAEEYVNRFCSLDASRSLDAQSTQWRKFSYIYIKSKSLLAEFCEQLLLPDQVHLDNSGSSNVSPSHAQCGSFFRPYLIAAKTFDICTEGGWENARAYLAERLVEYNDGMVVRPALGHGCHGVSMVVPISLPRSADELAEASFTYRDKRHLDTYHLFPLRVRDQGGTGVDSSHALMNIAGASDASAAALRHVQANQEREHEKQGLQDCQEGVHLGSDQNTNTKALRESSQACTIVVSQRLVYRRSRIEYDQSASDSTSGLQEGLVVPELKILWVYDKPVLATLRLADPDCTVWRRDLYDDGPPEALSCQSYAPAVWAILGISDDPDQDSFAKKQFEQMVHDLCADVAPKLISAYFHSKSMDRAIEEWRRVIDNGHCQDYHEWNCALRYMWHGRTDFLLSGEPGNIVPKLGEVQCSSGWTPKVMSRLWVSAQIATTVRKPLTVC